MLRFDHVGVVVADLEAALDFFVGLGFELDGRALVEGEWVDAIVGLQGVRSELATVRLPDGSGAIELARFLSPADPSAGEPAPANRPGFRHIAIEVRGLAGILEALRARGFDTVGEVRDYEDVYRLCYVRGPEGLIVELAERIDTIAAS